MGRLWLVLGALLAGLSVVTGAFAAHGLDKVYVERYAGQTRVVAGREIPLAEKYLHDFKTGAEYQMTHALGLLAVGLLAQRRSGGLLTIAGTAFVLGICLFSGSLYVLTWTGVRALGAITPIGGVAFLVGWAALALSVFRQPKELPAEA